MDKWTPSQVRKTVMFVGLMALGAFMVITGGTTAVVVGVLAGLAGVLQTLVD